MTILTTRPWVRHVLRCVYTSIHASHLARPGQRLCRQRPAARQPRPWPRLRWGAVAQCTCHFQDLVGIGLPLARLQQPFQPSSVLTLSPFFFFFLNSFLCEKFFLEPQIPLWETAQNSEGLFPITVLIPKGFFPTCPKGFIPKFFFFFFCTLKGHYSEDFYLDRSIILKILIPKGHYSKFGITTLRNKTFRHYDASE